MTSNAIVPFLYRSGFMKLCTQDCKGNTLLHTSLEADNQMLTSSILNYMMEEADRSDVVRAINLQNGDGDTPLHVAARMYPDSRLILEFVSLGAKLGVPNKDNNVVDYYEEEEKKAVVDDTESITPNSLTLSSLLTPDWEKEIGAPSAPSSHSVNPELASGDKVPTAVATATAIPVHDDADISSTSSDDRKLPEWMTLAETKQTPSQETNNKNNINLFL